MESVSDIATCLSRWPLTHGFMNWPKGKSEAIRIRGLIAPGSEGRTLNSFDYDAILGRKEFIFLSTLKLFPDYSFGYDTFLLIDPGVLKQPCKYSLLDIGKIIDLIPLSADQERSYPSWVQKPDDFDQIVGQQIRCACKAYSKEFDCTCRPDDLPKRYVVPFVCKSKAFQEYLECYFPDHDQFFNTIAEKIIEHNYGYDAYLRRDKLWPYSEEN